MSRCLSECNTAPSLHEVEIEDDSQLYRPTLA